MTSDQGFSQGMTSSDRFRRHGSIAVNGKPVSIHIDNQPMGNVYIAHIPLCECAYNIHIHQRTKA